MRNWRIVLAGVGGTTAVVAGAVGAHALALDLASRAAHSYELAVGYLLLHSVALLALGLWEAGGRVGGLALRAAAVLFACGMGLFSGSLILATVFELPALRAAAPWGGSALIAGWLAVATAGFAVRAPAAPSLPRRADGHEHA
jgi:uncharacterized membrane protein YgdD (TMEM256/DUF423 family)